MIGGSNLCCVGRGVPGVPREGGVVWCDVCEFVNEKQGNREPPRAHTHTATATFATYAFASL